MPEVLFNGPAGRLEGRYQPAADKNAPIAIVLHPPPEIWRYNEQPAGARAVLHVRQQRFYHTSLQLSRCWQFSKAILTTGHGELSDAAAALDWVQRLHPDSTGCWIAGFSFGSWIGMQLLMRRPEIEGFMSVAPQPNIYDFAFLAPCPSSGLIIHGEEDRVSKPRRCASAGRQVAHPKRHHHHTKHHSRCQSLLFQPHRRIDRPLPALSRQAHGPD